jgi:hypothetical protein
LRTADLIADSAIADLIVDCGTQAKSESPSVQIKSRVRILMTADYALFALSRGGKSAA